MKLTSIEVTYERVINLGNYNNVRMGVTAGADLDEGDEPTEAVAALQRQCREAVRAEYARMKALQNGQVPVATTTE